MRFWIAFLVVTSAALLVLGANHGHHHHHDHDGHHGHDHHDHDHHDHDHSHDHSHHDHHHDHHDDHHHDHSHHDHDHSHDDHHHQHETKVQEQGSALFLAWSTFAQDHPAAAAVTATVFVSSSSLVVMPLLPFVDGSARSDRLMKLLVSSAVGGLLGDVFLHILPHAVNPHDHHGHGHGDHGHDHHHHHDHSSNGHDSHNHLGDALKLGLPILSGILLFFVAEKIVSNFTGDGHGHSHSSSTKHGDDATVVLKKSVGDGAASPSLRSRSSGGSGGGRSPTTSGRREASPSPTRKSSGKGFKSGAHKRSAGGMLSAIKAAGWLNLVADMMHNFTDGLAIGVAFRSGTGASTTVAVFFHEVPHNVADFGILIQNGFSKKAALVAQFISATGSILGCILGLTLEKVIGLDLFVAGGFIYIATVDVIPDLLKDSNIWHTLQEAVAICFGVAMMALMLLAE